MSVTHSTIKHLIKTELAIQSFFKRLEAAGLEHDPRTIPGNMDCILLLMGFDSERDNFNGGLYCYFHAAADRFTMEEGDATATALYEVLQQLKAGNTTPLPQQCCTA